jgi:hypothetical protein
MEFGEGWPASSAAARMASNDQAVLHFVNPIARFRDFRIVRYEQESFAFFLHDALEQFEGAPGIRAIEISRRLIGQNYARIISEGARHGHALLFAAGKMAARPFQFAR